jgi:hypothetical protein
VTVGNRVRRSERYRVDGKSGPRVGRALLEGAGELDQLTTHSGKLGGLSLLCGERLTDQG